MNYKELDIKLQNRNSFQYRFMVFTPKDYDTKSTEKFPLLLFLHGAGERGENFELARKHGMSKLAAAGQEFPFIIVAPQCPKNDCWWPHHLEALLDYIEENYRVDSDRIYITGLSMGGYATWILGTMIPNRLAAIAPICGWGNHLMAAAYGTLPIWAFHGDADTDVLPQYSETMVNAVNEVGGNAMLTMYAGVGHNSWTQTYDNPALYEWLLNHRLSDRS